ncbi:MAG: hypothetical protein AMXMBFR19_17800 [Chthonomonadaceae bacterium]
MKEGGWIESADAWQKFVDEGDSNRTHLLDEVMLRLCGDVNRVVILDVGCGEGRFGKMLAELGASVVGIDPVRALLASAKEKGLSRLARSRGERLPFSNGAFDKVVSYVTFVDIEGFEEAVAEIARVLRPGGRCVVSNMTPISTCSSGWVKDSEGRKLHWPVHRYFAYPGGIQSWRGITVMQHHRTLERFFGAFLRSGFLLREYVEPVPTPAALEADPGMADLSIAPLFHAMLWERSSF